MESQIFIYHSGSSQSRYFYLFLIRILFLNRINDEIFSRRLGDGILFWS